MRVIRSLLARAFPPVPEAIADDFNLLRAVRMHQQTSWLTAVLLLTIPVTIYAASEGASIWVRIVLPIVIAALLLTMLVSSRRQYGGGIDADKARKFIKDTISSTPIIAACCSAWCVMSWMGAPAETKVYYPMILSMGSLTTVYCLSSVRLAATLNLVVGILPITILMLFSGNHLDFAAAVSLLMASGFLFHMIFAQHDQLVNLLTLKRQTQIQANTDPLTGLLNRRALDTKLQQEIDQADSDTVFTVALLDLDGFKPVNDRHGHAVGDQLLCEIARRLEAACGDGAIVARQGGDEFAVLLPAGVDCKRANIAGEILAALVAPCNIAGHPIRIGASVGVADWPQDGTSSQALFETADGALYAAKALTKKPQGKNTIAQEAAAVEDYKSQTAA